MRRNKGFTILELLVVVVIIAILAAIVVPGFIGAIDKSRASQELAEISSVRKAASMFYAENGYYPTMQGGQPTFGDPKNIKFSADANGEGLYPNYLASLPHFSYWYIDNSGAVYHVTNPIEDMNETGNIKINSVLKQETITGVSGTYTQLSYSRKGKTEVYPAVIVSKFGGTIKHPEDKTIEDEIKEPEIINKAPVAVITMTPETGINTNTTITWGYENSTDPDGDAIVDAEWQGMQPAYTTPGQYTVQLRVQDSKGAWSEWVSKTFSVVQSKIGQQLINPEAGWQRIDDNDSKIKYVGSNWNTYLNGGDWGTPVSHHQTSVITDRVEIEFYGTKIRLLAPYASGCTTKGLVNIDGKTEQFSEYNISVVSRTLVYEKTGLPLGTHKVIITFSNNALTLDAIDIDADGYLVTSVGQVLESPEAGWKRIDDSDSKIVYSKSFISISNSSCYNGGAHQVNIGAGEQTATIKFYGTKLRVIGTYFTTYPTSGVYVQIDGGDEIPFNINGALLFKALLLEVKDLPLGVHTIVLGQHPTSGSSGGLLIDAIDIDETGYISANNGDQLLQPQPTWERYDDSKVNNVATFVGTWLKNMPDSGQYMSTYTYTQSQVNGTMTFKFYGTKFRLIAQKYSNRSSDSKVIIDGTEYTVNMYGSGAAIALVFEKLGLPLAEHTVIFKEGTNNITSFCYDAIDIDEDGYLVTPLGSFSPTPDKGWTRMDDADSRVQYIGNWVHPTIYPEFYKGTNAFINTEDTGRLKFKIENTARLRIIGSHNSDKPIALSNDVYIDGKLVGSFSQYNAAGSKRGVLSFECSGIDRSAEHLVEIVPRSGLVVDAFDIDGAGIFKQP